MDSFVVREGESSNVYDATIMAQKETYFNSNSYEIESAPHDQQTQTTWGVFFFYSCFECDNLFTEKRLQTIYDFEKRILANKKYQDFCLKDQDGLCYPPNSVTNFFFDQNGKQNEIQPSLEYLYSHQNGTTRRSLVDKNFDNTDYKAKHLRSMFAFGSPLEGYKNKLDKEKEQTKKAEEYLVDLIPSLVKEFDYEETGNNVQILYLGCDDIFIMLDAWRQSKHEKKEISQNNFTRMNWAYSRATISMLITTSTSTGAFFGNIASTIPSIRYFGIFTGMAVVFNYLLVITWFPSIIIIWNSFGEKQCCFNLPDSKTVYKKICCCFHKPSSKKKKKSKQGNGIEMSDRFSSSNSSDDPSSNTLDSSYNSVSDSDSCSSHSTESVTTSMSGSEINIKSKTKDLENENKTNNKKTKQEKKKKTKKEKKKKIKTKTKKEKKKKKKKSNFIRAAFKKCFEIQNNEEEDLGDFRFLEKYFYKYHSPYIQKYRYLIILIFLSLLVFFSIKASQLKPAEEPAQFLPDDLPLMKAVNLEESGFAQKENVLTGYILWGIETIDRTGVDPLETQELGEVIYDKEFEPSSQESQNYIIQVCDQVKKESWVENGKIICFMEKFRDYINDETNHTFPVEPNNFAPVLSNFTNWAVTNILEKGNSQGYLGLEPFLDSSIKFDQKTEQLRFFSIIFNLTLSRRAPASECRPIYKLIEDFVTKINDDAPDGLKNARNVCGKWVGMFTEEILVKVALTSIFISLAISYLIIVVSTDNIFTSFYAIFAIMGVVVSIIGMMVLLGWQLGTIESICLTIIVGISVDYIVHFCHAYNIADEDNRYKKMRLASTHLGISVVSAAITTLSSAFVLFFTIVLFFSRFGVYIWMTIASSVLWSFVFFFAILAVIGPTKNVGKISFIYRKYFRRNKKKKKEKEKEKKRSSAISSVSDSSSDSHSIISSSHQDSTSKTDDSNTN
ncbi:sterol-sensing domain [Anaeramoeba flamelloides]|uniref:Sterol-sensing domain n=1 Tax=Anaeramoeba flamelloides TaxID=1746091 RepID=A0AAV8A7A5_9EUKA|nr:sterol-sensing domain [Anaeramoeba flamelloides]